jgi:hypothetical protein
MTRPCRAMSRGAAAVEVHGIHQAEGAGQVSLFGGAHAEVVGAAAVDGNSVALSATCDQLADR